MSLVPVVIARATLAFALLLAFAKAPATASQRADEINAATISIVAGEIDGTYIRIAADLAAVLDQGEEFRVLPVLGKGSVQNITDILYLRGVDIGIVQADVMAHMRKFGPHFDLQNRIHYIAKLFNEELHLIAGPGIRSLDDLRGQMVNLGVVGSGSHLTGNLVFEKLGIGIVPIEIDQALAIEKIRNGEIAATLLVSGKPADLVSDLKPEDNMHLVPIPFAEALQDVYLPATFEVSDYPVLVGNGEEVETLAVGAVMAVFNWPEDHFRYRRIEKFVDVFFSRINQFFAEPRHPKWREVNLAAELPGWTRFAAARNWLKNNTLQIADPKLEDEFKQFLTQVKAGEAPLDGARREELFRAFLVWRQQQSR